jgi:hypothetical protein
MTASRSRPDAEEILLAVSWFFFDRIQSPRTTIPP